MSFEHLSQPRAQSGLRVSCTLRWQRGNRNSVSCWSLIYLHRSAYADCELNTSNKAVTHVGTNACEHKDRCKIHCGLVACQPCRQYICLFASYIRNKGLQWFFPSVKRNLSRVGNVKTWLCILRCEWWASKRLNWMPCLMASAVPAFNTDWISVGWLHRIAARSASIQIAPPGKSNPDCSHCVHYSYGCTQKLGVSPCFMPRLIQMLFFDGSWCPACMHKRLSQPQQHTQQRSWMTIEMSVIWYAT